MRIRIRNTGFEFDFRIRVSFLWPSRGFQNPTGIVSLSVPHLFISTFKNDNTGFKTFKMRNSGYDRIRIADPSKTKRTVKQALRLILFS